MNPDTLVQVLQKGFHVTLGATTSLVESLQDSQKRDENLTKLGQQNWTLLTEEWAEKGTQTEQEARNLVDTLLAQYQGQPSTGSTTAPTSATPSTSPDIQLELQDLTAQLAALRAELENLRN